MEEKIAARTAELNAALAEEKELNRLKGNFISMVTHEIRTPLALILSSSEILSRYLDRLVPERRQEHLGIINESVQRMSAPSWRSASSKGFIGRFRICGTPSIR